MPSRTATPPGSSTPTPAPTPTAPTRVALSRLTYAWHWPNDTARPGRVAHTVAVPPVPELVRIGVGDHPRDPGERPFNRMAFTFTTAFPGYRFEFVRELIADPRGTRIPIGGAQILKIVFTEARAHSADGTHSTIASQPSRNLGLLRMADYARAGDFEGMLTYGIGIAPTPWTATPHFQVRAYEVETVAASGQHLYTIAIDIDATTTKE
jgi:hypothetical protein